MLLQHGLYKLLVAAANRDLFAVYFNVSCGKRINFILQQYKNDVPVETGSYSARLRSLLIEIS